MKIGFIGAGKVGFSLGRFFVQGGIPVTGYYSRHRASAKEAAAFTGTEQYDTAADLIADSDALFLTVPDGAITAVWQEIGKYDIKGKMICHCSGVMTAAEAFPQADRTGAFVYSMHPLFPFHSKYETYRELPGAFFCLEGTGPHLPLWTKLLQQLGVQVHVMPATEKKKYHAACAIASNLMCALLQESLDLLKDCGFSETEARSALTPLAKSNLTHILEEGPVAALTGPVERGDAETVKKHLACFASPEDREIYRLLSVKLLALAAEKHPGRDDTQLKKLLETPAQA